MSVTNFVKLVLEMYCLQNLITHRPTRRSNRWHNQPPYKTVDRLSHRKSGINK